MSSFPGKVGVFTFWSLLLTLLLMCCSVDTVGVHYSATIWRWYRNWVGNKEKVEAKFGARWYRVRLKSLVYAMPCPICLSR